jgi:hypothetical protein
MKNMFWSSVCGVEGWNRTSRNIVSFWLEDRGLVDFEELE